MMTHPQISVYYGHSSQSESGEQAYVIRDPCTIRQTSHDQQLEDIMCELLCRMLVVGGGYVAHHAKQCYREICQHSTNYLSSCSAVYGSLNLQLGPTKGCTVIRPVSLLLVLPLLLQGSDTHCNCCCNLSCCCSFRRCCNRRTAAESSVAAAVVLGVGSDCCSAYSSPHAAAVSPASTDSSSTNTA